MSPESDPVTARNATPADVEKIVAAVTTAFFDDPLWGPAFPDPGLRAEQAAAMWRILIRSALRYPWLLVTEHIEAAALWIPPGGRELTEDEEHGFADLLVSLIGRETAEGILAVLEVLDAAHPHEEPHFYLSLLATHRDHWGKGLGMALLRENLARIDALGAPAYLESCNPANNERYESVGFIAKDDVRVPSGHVVTTMWRPARR